MPVNVQSETILAALDGSVMRKFGGAASVPTGSDQILWPLVGTTYPWPSGAETTTAESDSASDDGVVISVLGLDADGFEIEETITLLTSPVTLTNKFFRVYRIRVYGTAVNVGIITVKHGLDVLAVVPVGEAQTQQLIGTVPVNRRYIVPQLMLILGASRGAEFKVWVRPPGRPFSKQAVFYIENTSIVIPFNPHFAMLPLTDYYITAEMTQAGSAAAQLFAYVYSLTS